PGRAVPAPDEDSALVVRADRAPGDPQLTAGRRHQGGALGEERFVADATCATSPGGRIAGRDRGPYGHPTSILEARHEDLGVVGGILRRRSPEGVRRGVREGDDRSPLAVDDQGGGERVVPRVLVAVHDEAGRLARAAGAG